jgi:hypothetical protein
VQRSLLDGRWLPQFPQFGGFNFAGDNITVESGAAVNGLFHAEAHHDRVLGADFAYSAIISADWTQSDLSAHLQFRISDEGRYGVRLQAGTIAFYRFLLGNRPCAADPSIITPCPLWPLPDVNHPELDDDPEELPLGPVSSFDPALRTLKVTVFAEGSQFVVSFGTPSQDLGRLDINDIELGVGRFGIYVRAATPSFEVTFSDLVATTEPTATSNFALLYSTPGYDLNGTKRALVRTVNDIDSQDYDDANSTFTLTNEFGEVKIRHRRFEVWRPFEAGRFEAARLLKAEATFRRTLGFQFLAADFTDLREAGRYTLKARLATSGGIRVLRSAPFDIVPRLVTEKMLWPLSILNADARRAADEDFRRNWVIESGGAAWSVGQDGAFVVEGADDQAGAILRRVSTIGSRPLSEVDSSFCDFRLVARITIVSGCDAQLQFRITDDERWAVTLQAGDEGGCQYGTGPGAIRLHREGPAVPGRDHFEVVASHSLDSNPFEVGRAYDIEVRTSGAEIEVLLDGISKLQFGGAANPRVGEFALKAWASTVRFENVAVWARDVGLSRPVPGVWIPYSRATNLSSQGFRITTPDSENKRVPADASFPLAAQQHGFHDCNSYIGEVTSHSVFLSSLLDVWATRAHNATSQQQDLLRHAILTAVLYLNELYEQGNRSGAFAHQEPGRTALGVCDKVLTTQFAMYGLSAFAEKGDAVDKKLTLDAFHLATKAWDWLDEDVGSLGTSWVVGNVEHVAATSSQGDLLVFFFSPGPGNDWQVVNVSQKLGQQIEGAPRTSWVVGNVEHVAASSPAEGLSGVGPIHRKIERNGDLLVFFFSPDKDWNVVNVSQKLGQKIGYAPSTSWVVGDVEHVAASWSEGGDLLVFFFSPDKDWQVVNVSVTVGQYQGRRDIFLDSIVAIRMARAAQREGMAAEGWLKRAKTNVDKVLTIFGQPDGIATSFRPTLRSIPWFEGVYEAFFRGPFVLTPDQGIQLKNIADQLMALMRDPANGFCVMPQANDTRTPQDPTLPVWNWNNLADLPLAAYPIPTPSKPSDPPPPRYAVGDWYLSEHFATAAADCVYIGRLAGEKSIERLATGNLYWILGLNPGIPTTKVVPPAPTSGPWSAASFVHNGPGAFARSWEGNRTRTNDVKEWLANWELSASSRHREIWAIDPLNNGFQSIVNGHVLRESQWHYWSVGTAGWVSAETFMLIDASFLKAALALEDWHSGIRLVRAKPYDVTKLL